MVADSPLAPWLEVLQIHLLLSPSHDLSSGRVLI